MLNDDNDAAAAHIHKMSHKYNGQDYPEPDGRVLVRVRPSRVFGQGVD